MKIYLAGPLFTHAEQRWLSWLKEKIETLASEMDKSVEVAWPFELVPQDQIPIWGDRAKHEIFAICKKHLQDSDLLVAVLDGPMVDDGTAWEIGWFYANRIEKRHIIGIRTDLRQAGETTNADVNVMIDCACDVIVHCEETLLNELKQYFRV